jgi:hypothetical protein
MNRCARSISIFTLAGALLGTVCSAARADDSANPKYTAWSNFKAGSSSTVEADMDVQGNKFHISMVRTLVSIDADKAVVAIKSTVNVMGHDHDAPIRTETISAKGNPDSLSPTGEKDVEAMGKTFKCKVFDAKGNPNAVPDRSAGPIGNVDNMKATVYVSDQVPGGLVRLESTTMTGKDLTFVLTAMEAK